MAQGGLVEQKEQLEQAIAHMESQRAALGDAVVDASLAALKKELYNLDAAGQAEQRKLVTVLFMDTVGSTEMIRDLDPEENLAIMDTAMQRLSPPVEQYGGRIVRYMGDGFMAVFGLPVARENDPRIAVRAGLGILEAAQAFAAELEETDGLPSGGIASFQVRVGIDTGWVAVGGLTEAEGTIAGATVNLAARLESAAPAGGLLISQHTYQHVRGLFDLRPLDPVPAKGFPDPIPVYQILRAKARSFRTRSRGVEGVETSMIGRERELSLLQERFLDAAEESEGQFVTVVGEAGLGKSRLLYEFENWVDLQARDVLLFRGRAQLETQRLPYGLLRDLFAFRLKIQDDDTAELVREKMVSGFEEVLGAEAESEKKAHFVGHLLGHDFVDSLFLDAALNEPQQTRDRSLSYMTDYFAAAAAKEPVLVLLEDLHWADESSLDGLARLGPELAGQRVMFLGATRHTLFERRPNWMEGQNFHLRIELAPLSRRNSRKLVAEVLQRLEEVPDALHDLIVGNAEGNPFYMEELVKMLVEEGAIVKGEPKWQVRPEKLTAVQVPSTLTGVLQARLEGLPGQERMVLQQASVVGRVFWDRALTYLNKSGNNELEGAKILEGLDELRSKEMIFRRELSAFAGANEHIFKHALLREVTYESVLKRVRRVYHALVADWLIARSGERAGEITGLIADHLQQAGKRREAAEYLLQAGDRARELYAHQEAIDSYRRALDYLSEVGDSNKAARTYMKLGLAYNNAFEFARSRQAYQEGFALWQQANVSLAVESSRPAPHALRLRWAEPTSLDPGMVVDTVSLVFIDQLFSGLVLLTTELDVVPDVAHSWQVLEGGRRYRFHLRDDVFWSDGEPVTAADFAFAWRRVLAPEHSSVNAPSLFTIKNGRAFHEGSLADWDDVGVSVSDTLTLEVTLENPDSTFLYRMCDVYAFAVPSHREPEFGVRERGTSTSGASWMAWDEMVTNGPFKLAEWKPGQELFLESNPDYHGYRSGNVETVEILVPGGDGDKGRLALYEADRLDMTTLASAHAVQARNRFAGDHLSYPQLSTSYLGFNTRKAPFTDPRFRRALALATDKERLSDAASEGLNIPATGGLVPPGMPGHAAGIALPYDPEGAHRLLTEAGYSKRGAFPAVEFLIGPGYTQRQASEYLASRWYELLGVEIEVVQLAWPELLERMRTDPPEIFRMGYTADFPDPDNFLSQGSFLYRTGWRNETYEHLVRQARETMDQKERMALYRRAENILVEETPIIPINYGRASLLIKPWVRRYPTSPLKMWYWKDVVIEPH